ncbi:MAG TPA: NUDIX domain-containing protein [Pseudolabrys sp.]|nr:NUDIX domain-containing protein [Pseudolabrys sp.]
MARRDEVSAGLLVFRRAPKLAVLLGHPGGPYWSNKDDGAWSIPKGLVEGDSALLAAAQREFTEETGFEAPGPFVPLQPVTMKSGKIVHAWAFEADFNAQSFTSGTFEMEWPPRSGRRAQFPEIDRLQWFVFGNALRKIISYQQPFLMELKQLLEGSAKRA